MTRDKQTPKQEKAFAVWYADSERGCRAAAKTVGVSVRTIERWRDELDWKVRARKIDRAGRERVNSDLARKQADYIKRLAQEGAFLKSKGAAYLKDHGADNGQQAINAMALGDKFERMAHNLPDYVFEIISKSDDGLKTFVDDLLSGAADAAGEGAAADETPDPQPD